MLAQEWLTTKYDLINLSSAGLNSLGTSFLSLPPSLRLGILHPTSMGFKLLAVAYLVYHALKLEHIEVVKGALSSGDLSAVHSLTISLAELHYSDIIYGLCMDGIWVIYGFCMDRAWIIYGFCMDDALIIYGFCMDYVWIIY